jgi:hypothetical protein
MDAEKYPLDVAVLSKGDVITQDRLEGIFGFTEHSDPKRYSLEMMNLGLFIERECRKLNRPVVLKGVRNQIHILNDAEATEETEARMKRGVKIIFNNHRKMQEVNVANLDSDQTKEHDRRLTAAGFIVGSLASGLRRVQTVLGYRRLTPRSLGLSTNDQQDPPAGPPAQAV